MAILRNSSKLESQEANILVLKGKLPIPHVGCFEVASDGTPAHDPEQKEVEPIKDVPEEKPDHRPKDWYDQQCKYENYIGMLRLNSQPLNKASKSEGDQKDAG